MVTITEDYVSFEIAKLLKERGFNQELDWAYYEENGNPTLRYSVDNDGYGTTNDYKGKNFVCIAPTLQMAMKWLREIHNIDVSVVPLRSHKEYLPRVESDILDYDAIPCRKYEDACESAIKYCLENLI